MTPPLHRYPSHKPPGGGWLSDVPAHWDVRRLKAAVANVVNLARELKNNDISLALEDVESWTGRYTPAGARVAFESQGKRFRADDVLFGKLRPYLAKVTRPDQGGVCVGEFLVLRPSDARVSPEYLERLLRSKPVIDAIDGSTFGAKMPRADWQFIGGMPIPIPPLPEQRAIAHYLDYVDRRIQRYVSAKRRLIELLEEERQAVVAKAVTRGLDPDVHLKPSGIEWLGEVPEHWEVVQLGRAGVFSKGSGGTKDDETPAGIPCVRYGDLYTTHKYFIRQTRSHVPPEKASAYTPIERGDVLFPTSGETLEEIGKSAVNLMQGPVRCGGDLVIFRPTGLMEPRFAGYALDSPAAQAQKSQMGRGITIMHIYSSQLRYLWLARPGVAEQGAIADYLDRETKHRDVAITRAHRQIELMEEYRTRLVADVVTGKLDVRDAADLLPHQEVDDDWPEDGPPADFLGDGIPEEPTEGMAIESEVAR